MYCDSCEVLFKIDYVDVKWLVCNKCHCEKARFFCNYFITSMVFFHAHRLSLNDLSAQVEIYISICELSACSWLKLNTLLINVYQRTPLESVLNINVRWPRSVWSDCRNCISIGFSTIPEDMTVKVTRTLHKTECWGDWDSNHNVNAKRFEILLIV